MCNFIILCDIIYILYKVSKLRTCKLTAVHVSREDNKQVYDTVKCGKYQFGK